jgi:hypothetical protein
MKITKGGPWLLRQNVVTVEEYDGSASPDSVDLNFLLFGFKFINYRMDIVENPW